MNIYLLSKALLHSALLALWQFQVSSFNFNFSLLSVILEETITRVLSAVISSFSSNYKYLYYSFLLADL